MNRKQKRMYARFVLLTFQRNLVQLRRTIKKTRSLAREQGHPLSRKIQKAAACFAARAAAFAADTGCHVSYGIDMTGD